MKRMAALAGLLGAVLVIPAPAGAQEAPVTVEITEIDLTNHPATTATLNAPRALAGQALEPGDIEVVENGERFPVDLVRLSDDKLEVVLVVDTSGSMRGAPMDSAKVAASAFISRLPLEARVALVGFGATPTVASGMTQDRNALIGAIQGLTAAGETALFDAVDLATQQFTADPDARRSVVVLSDGGDTASAISDQAAAEKLRATGARVDVVELVSPESARVSLDLFASVGGGQVASADDPAALAGIYDGVAATLASQYRISWRTTSFGPTEAAVRLTRGDVSAEAILALSYPAPPPEPEPVVTTPPPPETAPPPSPVFGSTWALVGGAAAAFLALLLGGVVAASARGRQHKRARLGLPRQAAAATPSFVSGMAEAASVAADAALERHGKRGLLNGALERAGIALRPGEFAVLVASAGIVALLVGGALGGPVAALVLLGVVVLLARLGLGVLAARRRSRFAGQLGDVLQLMAGSLRSGYGLLQAIDVVAREALPPASDEFRRIVTESRLGRPLHDSLQAMVDRVGGEDLEWVVQAIDIHREVGGDLAEVLDTVAGTIRERNQIKRQIKALSAEGRLSAYVLLALPVGLVLFLNLSNPGYLAPMTTGGGLVASAVAAVLMGLGALWLKKICRLVY